MKRQIFEVLSPNSKLYSVFNSNDPDDSLVEKFLGDVQSLDGYKFYFPLLEDDEYYAEEGVNNDETVSNDSNKGTNIFQKKKKTKILL